MTMPGGRVIDDDAHLAAYNAYLGTLSPSPPDSRNTRSLSTEATESISFNDINRGQVRLCRLKRPAYWPGPPTI